MINKSELRIGNMYHHKSGKGGGPIIITEEIMGKIFSHDKEYALDDFDPIPFTEEYIEQLLHGNTPNCLGDFGISRSTDPARPLCLSYLSVHCLTIFHAIKFEYLHQVQNMHFYLKGKELNIFGCGYCKGTTYDPHQNHETTMKPCPQCQ